MLKKLYQYSEIAYIGGGFGNGVHNTLEPAIHKNLLLFGPKHINFPETLFFIKHKIGHVIKNQLHFDEKVHLLLNDSDKKKTNNLVRAFFKQKTQNLDTIVNQLTYLKN